MSDTFGPGDQDQDGGREDEGEIEVRGDHAFLAVMIRGSEITDRRGRRIVARTRRGVMREIYPGKGGANPAAVGVSPVIEAWRGAAVDGVAGGALFPRASAAMAA